MLELSVLKGCLRDVTTRSPRRVRRLWALLMPLGFQAPLLLQAACAAPPRPAPEAAAPTSVAPEAEAEPAPVPSPTASLTEVDALEHDLSVSEARLDEELARQGAAEFASEPPAAQPTQAEESADSAGSARAGGPARPQRSRAPAPSGRSATDPEPAKLGSPCDLGCRALASMQRAQLRICEIVGPNARCQRATERVQAAVERVRAAGCECRTEAR